MPADSHPEYRETREHIYMYCMELCGVERREAKCACSAATLSARVRLGVLPINSFPNIFDDHISQADIAAEENQPHTFYSLPLPVKSPYTRDISGQPQTSPTTHRLSSRGMRLGGFVKNSIYKNTDFSFLSSGLIKRREIF